MAVGVCAQVLPIWGINTPADGGVSFGSADIGMLNFVCGIMLVRSAVLIRRRCVPEASLSRGTSLAHLCGVDVLIHCIGTTDVHTIPVPDTE